MKPLPLMKSSEPINNYRLSYSGETGFIASLLQKNSAGSEAVLPLTSSSNIKGNIEMSEPGLVIEPVEWISQASPTVDTHSSGPNVSEGIEEENNSQRLGSRSDGNSLMSPSQHDESAGDVDSGKVVRPEVGEFPWLPTEDVESVPGNSGDLAQPMLAGLVGAALQGSLRKKEKMTTMHGNIPTGEQQTTNEQTSQGSSSDDKEAPPRAA